MIRYWVNIIIMCVNWSGEIITWKMLCFKPKLSKKVCLEFGVTTLNCHRSQVSSSAAKERSIHMLSKSLHKPPPHHPSEKNCTTCNWRVEHLYSCYTTCNWRVEHLYSCCEAEMIGCGATPSLDFDIIASVTYPHTLYITIFPFSFSSQAAR